ncbi:MAG TPA: bifunctional nuclease domain-containing protein [Armatimonadota bacterium]|nr:bifunctional nuclease domain-containing protein [Armatimonadota bacterium]
MAAEPDEVRVEVVGVFEQQVTLREHEHQMAVLLLRDAASREVSVPIGSCEGLAIQISLEHHVVPRPYTHDLALRLLEKLSARLERVVVDAVSAETSHATIHVRTAEGPLAVDARGGDAVALALRAEAPIFVAEELLAARGNEDTLS